MRRIRITKTEYIIRYILCIITSIIGVPIYLLYELVKYIVDKHLLNVALFVLFLATLIGLHAIPEIIANMIFG